MSIRKFRTMFPQLGNHVYIDEQATVIGDVIMGDDCSVWPGAVIRGDVNSIRIGKGTNIQDNSVLHVTHKSVYEPEGAMLAIGDYVTVGHQVMLHACTINDRCLIGIGATILDKVIVPEHVFIGAHALVTEGKVLESGYLYLGTPAKKIRALTEKEIEHFMYSANQYIKLKNEYLFAG